MTEPAPNGDAAAADASQHEVALIARLRSGDEQAFGELIDRYHPALLRLASVYCGDRAAAEDVVQETLLGVIRGIGRFEGRSSLKTWLFRILTNRAKTRAQRDGRTIPFSAAFGSDADSAEPSVPPDRFIPAGLPYAGHWASPPGAWDELPEARLLARETREVVNLAIAGLPASQREVITLRDIEGWASDEVCNVLEISESHQRVLLHRARSRVRRALEAYLGRTTAA